MRWSAILALAIIGSMSANLHAETGRHWWPWRPARPLCPTCADDYCAKALPAPYCPTACAGRDDYCPKRQPSAHPVRCFGCDDYAPKSLPCLAPCYPAWYVCPLREPSLRFEPVEP